MARKGDTPRCGSGKFQHGEEVILVKPPTFEGLPHPSTPMIEAKGAEWFAVTHDERDGVLHVTPEKRDSHVVIAKTRGTIAGYWVDEDCIASLCTDEDVEAAISSIKTREVA